MSMRCLLLGSTGYVGGQVKSELVSQGMQVFPLLRSAESGLVDPNVFLTDPRGDFQLEELVSFLRLHSIDSVVHAANLFDSSPDARVAEEMFYANLLVPGKALRAAVEVGARVFVNLASGWQLNPHKTEQSPDYVSTKQAFRSLLTHHSAKISGVSIFVNEIIGTGDNRTKLVNQAIDCGLANKPLKIHSPNQILGFLDADDLAREVATLLRDPQSRPGEYIYQNFSNVAVKEMLAIIADCVGDLQWSGDSDDLFDNAGVDLPQFGEMPRQNLVNLVQAIVGHKKNSGAHENKTTWKLSE